MAEATTTLTQAREAVELAVQDLPGVTIAAGTNGLKRMDYAIRAAMQEFNRRTFCTLTSDTATATADDFDLDVSDLTFFHPSRLLRVTATHPTTGRIYPVDVTNYRDAALNHVARDVALQFPYVDLNPFQLRPTSIAFKDAENAVVWPTPDVAWVFTFYYRRPITDTAWTMGVTDGSGITFNIPDDMIDGVLWYGVPAFFENPNPANRYQDSSRRRFEQHITVCRGRTALDRVVQANIRDYI